MKIATQHSEAVGQRARVSVKEWLLFDWIALHAAHVSPRHVESAAPVVTHLANSRLTLWNWTAVSTGKTAHSIAIEFLVKIALTHILVNDVAQGWHENLSAFGSAGVPSTSLRTGSPAVARASRPRHGILLLDHGIPLSAYILLLAAVGETPTEPVPSLPREQPPEGRRYGLAFHILNPLRTGTREMGGENPTPTRGRYPRSGGCGASHWLAAEQPGPGCGSSGMRERQHDTY